jgi:hypothetical protein
MTRVNAEGLAQIGLPTNGIVALLGEAEGGTPLEVYTIDDPALAKEYFRSGPLADAIGVAFNPTRDPRIPGGAFRVLAVKTNDTLASRASVILYQTTPAVPGTNISDTAAAGSTTTVVALTTGGLTVDAHIGNMLRVTYAATGESEDRLITDNAAGTVTVGVAFSTAPAVGDQVQFLAPVVTLTTRDYGTHANQTTVEYEPGVDSGSHAWTTNFEGKSQTSEDLGPQAYLELEYIGNSVPIVDDSGTADGAGTTTSIADSVNLVGDAAAYDNMWVFASNVGSALDVDNIRRISTNTAAVINVTNAFTNLADAPTAPGIGTPWEVRRGVIRTGTAAAGAASTITLEATIDFALNELANLVIEITAGTGAGQRRSIASNTAGNDCVITVDEAWVTVPDATSVYSIKATEIARGKITGAAGVANLFQTELQEGGATSPSTDLSITITSSMTINDIVAQINADGKYVAAVGPGAVSGLTLMNTFDFGVGAGADVATSPTISGGVDLRNDKGVSLTPPGPTADPPVTWNNRFRRDLAVLIDSINDSSEYITATRAAGSSLGAGSSRPEFTGGTVAVTDETTAKTMTGGVRGTSTNANFQSALDLLLAERHNFIVPLISEDLTNQGYGSTATFAAVAAQLAAHVNLAASTSKNECGGALGMSGTKAEIIAQANTLNEEDIQICGQKITTLDVSRNLVEMDEWAMAVTAVSMRAGAPEVGEPLTYKFINTTTISQDASWDPSDITDINAFVKNGILFAEPVSGKGFRFLRDLTSWSRDDNLALAEGSTRDAVRYVAYGLRTFLEEKFTGVKAVPANAASIKDQSAKWLEAANADNIIVASLDEDGNLVPQGFHKLRVTISGDIATIRVEIFPVVGINFQLNDISLQLPRLEAA